MSARRRQDAVLRLLGGEDLEWRSRQLGVTAAAPSGWRGAFLAAGAASLRTRPADARDAEIGRLKEKVGDLTIERRALDPCPMGPGPKGPGGANELLQAKIERLETRRPWVPRRSRR
jgi:transposase